MSAEEIQKATFTSLSFCIAEIASADQVIDKLEQAKVAEKALI